MRIVIISDTHNRHNQIEVPDGDVLIHCGDATSVGKVEEIENFNKWLLKQPHKHKIFIAGNHDKLFEDNPRKAEVRITGAIYLRDSFIMINGLKFYGSPWQPRFFDWAFNLDRGEAIKKKWNLIPIDTNVLITHGPPSGILDYSPYGFSKAGCEDLLEAVERIKPRLHCFGHFHSGYGMQSKIWENGQETIFVNGAIVGEDYKVRNKPIAVDL